MLLRAPLVADHGTGGPPQGHLPPLPLRSVVPRVPLPSILNALRPPPPFRSAPVRNFFMGRLVSPTGISAAPR